MNVISANPTVSAASAYTAGDAVGGKLTFEGCPETGLIHHLIIVDDDKENAEMDLFLFNADFTAVSDNAAFSVAAADMDNLITVINVATYRDGSSCGVAVKENLSIPFELGNSTGRMYGQLVTRGTPTYTNTTDIQLRLAVLPYRG